MCLFRLHFGIRLDSWESFDLHTFDQKYKGTLMYQILQAPWANLWNRRICKTPIVTIVILYVP